MSAKKISSTELVYCALLLFAPFTVLQGIAVFEKLNRLWMAFVGILLFLHFVIMKYNKKELLTLYLTLILHIVAFAFTKEDIYAPNIIFYFALWVLIYLFFCKTKGKVFLLFVHQNSFLDGVLFFWTVIVGVSALLPSSYEDGYFLSFTGTSFRLMPSALLIIAITTYMRIATGNKKYNYFLFLPLYVTFMGISRTYLLVNCVFVLLYIYMTVKSKRAFYRLMIPIMTLTMVFLALGGIADKIASSLSSNTYWDAIDPLAQFTSGRSVFWRWDLEAFFALPLWQQFVGNGFNFVYDVNGARMAKIWAHNDYINILMNFGYIGLVIYNWVFFHMIRTYWPKNTGVPKVVRYLIIGVVFFNSMFNMSYTYVCAMIAYPIMLAAIAVRYDDAIVLEKMGSEVRIYERINFGRD